MRTEHDILNLILDTARADDRIRAVMMNGSRVNPAAPRDVFQDFDVVYFVTEVEPYRNNLEWIARFGELMILQMPEAKEDPPPQGGGHFVYLMQFADGHRIDLTLYPIDRLDALEDDSLSVLLLDKDGLFPPLAPPSARDYLPQPPTAQAFADCCNEFWWIAPSVAKGLWRAEILYAKHYMEHYARAQLEKMLGWYVGVKTDFTGDPGKCGKYLDRYLEPALWDALLATYSEAGYDATWDALFAACDLFRRVALVVAEHCGFAYPHGDDARVSAHLAHVRELPRDAERMY